jgi:hypothetical protein
LRFPPDAVEEAHGIDRVVGVEGVVVVRHRVGVGRSRREVREADRGVPGSLLVGGVTLTGDRGMEA